MDSEVLLQEIASFFAMGFGFGATIIFLTVAVRSFYDFSK